MNLLSLCFQLLSKPKFSSIEKIKTVGSTYMAAAGLNENERQSYDDCVSVLCVNCLYIFTEFYRCYRLG